MAKEVKNAVETEATVSATKSMKRGTVIQAVKAIAVLVCICLVCGALLALCHDVFYISDDLRFSRSMAKIYPELDTSKVEKRDLVTDFKTNATYGEVKSVVTDGKVYIIEALGVGGYASGTVTLYVVVGIADAKIVSWAVKENVGQSYIDRIPSKAGTTWYVGKDVSNALDLEMTGATVLATSTAISNAVNMAAFYCRSALGVGKNPEADAQKAILALLGDDYSSYTFASANVLGDSSKVDEETTVKSLLDNGSDEITFVMYADGDKGAVKAYVYGEDADTQKIIVFAGDQVKLSANLTESDELVTKVTEFNGKFHAIKSGNYNGYAYISNVDGEGAVYTVAGIKSAVTPKTYVLKVTIATDGGKGKVTAIEIETDGFVPGDPSKDAANKLATSLVGVTLDDIQTKYDSDKQSGATQSANLIRIAVEAALRDYDANLASNN